jgi:DNA-binding LytR/AlgR family response regulator
MMALTIGICDDCHEEAIELFKRSANAKTASKFFTVSKKAETIRLDYDDIYYFEKIGHKIKVHTANGDIEFYGNFIKLLDRLEGDFLPNVIRAM